MTAPNAATPLSGTVAVSANAADNVGVVGVQFLLDGAALGAEDTTTPYSVNWDTTTAANGNHVCSRVRATLPATRQIPRRSPSQFPMRKWPASWPATPSTKAQAPRRPMPRGTDSRAHSSTVPPSPRQASTAMQWPWMEVNDYVNLGNPTALQLTGSMTVSAWIYSSAFPADDAAIVSKRGSGPLIGFQLDTTVDQGTRTIGFKLTNSSGGQMVRYGATTLQTNTWYYVTGVYDATAQTLNVYLNGQLDNGALLGTVTTSQQNSTLNVNIGQRSGSPGAYNFNGLIDDVRIYNRPLTVAQIQTDMITPVTAGLA